MTEHDTPLCWLGDDNVCDARKSIEQVIVEARRFVGQFSRAQLDQDLDLVLEQLGYGLAYDFPKRVRHELWTALTWELSHGDGLADGGD